jgi:hypothetical protein
LPSAREDAREGFAPGEGRSLAWLFRSEFMGSIMRAEAEQLVESIKQSVGLLRRHL